MLVKRPLPVFRELTVGNGRLERVEFYHSTQFLDFFCHISDSAAGNSGEHL
jgi:hypothetical protein